MFQHLSNPEYVHVLLNPLPIYGVAMGLLAMVVALVTRARGARLTALAVLFVSAFSAWPVYHYGERAIARVLPLADSDGAKWLEEHEHRGQRLIYLFYALAALAATAALTERFAPRAAIPLAIATAVLATGTLAAGEYIASAGGRIRHREFRYVLPPEEPKK